jgi:2',3'-cyclic-nucleotide 2'-phosphodiesterase
MAKVLIFGDIMGRPGRQALAGVLPQWKEQHQPDVVLINVENLTHGKGVTLKTIAEMEALGIDCYTSGNHVFDTGPLAAEVFEKYPKVIRPHNYSGDYPGTGFFRFAKNEQQYLVINLGGKVFFENQFKAEINNPFFALDEILEQQAQKGDIIIIDFHAEATSEKNGMGWHADGRATVVYGTHTHIPTADEKILPKGTAFLTDVGMTGPKDSVIGVIPDNALKMFLEKDKFRMEIPESGPVVINGLLVTTEGSKPTEIKRLQTEINYQP